MIQFRRPTHLSEGDIVRYLDGELAGRARGRADAHLAGCAACAARLERCRAESGAAASLLADAEVPALDPVRRARSLAAIQAASADREAAAPARHVFAPRRFEWAPLRAAAAIALLIASIVAVSPAGAWIADLFRGFAAGDERVEEPAPAPTHRVGAPGAVIAYTPERDVFTITLRNRQQAGTLTVHVEAGEAASARVGSGVPEVDVVILPDGFRIENDAASATDYTIGLPTRLRVVRIRIGDAPELRLALRPGETWTGRIDLGTVTDTAAPALVVSGPDGSPTM